MKDERKKEIVREAKRRLKYAPEGRIYINTSHGSIQYLYGKEKSQRKYISKNNRPLIGRLLEKRYNLEVLKAIE